MTDPRRTLPSVDRLLHDPAVAALLAESPRDVVVAAVRESLDAARDRRAGPPEVQPRPYRADGGEECEQRADEDQDEERGKHLARYGNTAVRDFTNL